jgi:hypothetical protein
MIMTAPAGGAETYWRVPGTFTSPGQFGAYLLFNGIVAASLLISGISKVRRTIAGISLAMITLALFVSGSRAPFLLMGMGVLSVVVLARSLWRVAIATITVLITLSLAFSYFSAGVRARFASIADYEHVERFQGTYFGQLFLPALIENPLGAGLGVSTIGARHFADINDMLIVESYLGIVALEMGIPGLLTILWVAVAIMLALYRGWQRIGRSPLSMIWYGLAAFVAITVGILPVSTSIDHSPTTLYFWFAVGASVKVAELARRGQQRAIRDRAGTLKGTQALATASSAALPPRQEDVRCHDASLGRSRERA